MTTADTDFALPGDDGDDDVLELRALAMRRRRRLPRLTAVLAVGVVAAGAFIVGAEVQKQWGGSSSSGGSSGASAFASRFGSRTGVGRTTTGAGGFAAGGFAGGGATVGTVTVIKGSTLYVTDSSGNTEKVTMSPASSVTKTVSSNAKGILPGDTVVIRGTQQKNGSIAAQTISVGSAGSGFCGSSSGGATGFGGGGSGG
jgi:hypothetical protein